MSFAPVQIHQLGFSVGGDFQIFALDVSTGSDPLTFEYDLDEDQFKVGGDLTVKFKGNSVDVDLTDGGNPGLIIQDGSVEKLVAKVSADFKLFGAQVEVHGLTFQYQAGKFVMYGDQEPALTLNIPTGGSTQELAADLGSQSDPGLVIVDGALTQLNMGLSGSFDVFGLKLIISDGHVDWQPADDSLLISGAAFVDFGVFQTNLALGIDGKPGLSIVNGSFKVDSVEFDLENAQLGPVALNNLKVTYEEDGQSFDLDVDVDLGLPGGWDVKGEFDFVAGKLDTISVDLSNPNGIVEIGDTGLLVTDIHAKVRNIENPANIVVSGGLAVVWGEKFSLLGQQVYLFRAEGDFTADATALIIDVSAQLGAHSPDGLSNWKGLLGEGDGRIDLDWGDGVYSLHVEVDGLAAIFDLTGDFTFAAGKDIRFLAEVDVVVPNFVPFIGGDRLGGSASSSTTSSRRPSPRRWRPGSSCTSSGTSRSASRSSLTTPTPTGTSR